MCPEAATAADKTNDCVTNQRQMWKRNINQDLFVLNEVYSGNNLGVNPNY